MNATKFNEELLTAYVMGELPADERQTVAEAIASDPMLKAEVESLRQFCGALWDELQREGSEAEDGLGDKRKADLAKKFGALALTRQIGRAHV